jgi:hypothetical protein
VKLRRIQRPRALYRCDECGCADGRQAIGPQAIHEACPAPDGPGWFVLWFDYTDAARSLVEFARTGNLRCIPCGKLYADHPLAYGPAAVGYDGQPFLHVVCGARGTVFDRDARLVKL